MNEYEYLSDQALEDLMQVCEEQGLLSAPRELKPAILAEAEAARPLPSAQGQPEKTVCRLLCPGGAGHRRLSGAGVRRGSVRQSSHPNPSECPQPLRLPAVRPVHRPGGTGLPEPEPETFPIHFQL